MVINNNILKNTFGHFIGIINPAFNILIYVVLYSVYNQQHCYFM